MYTGKVWGHTQLLLKAPMLEIHRLSIVPNAACSWHKHEYKCNTFFVLSGEVFIEVEKRDYPLIDETRLIAGSLTTVRPNEFHRFRTGYKACKLLELYHVEPLAEDIIRRDVGSKL